MNILGMGAVFSGGRGIKAFEDSLLKGWQQPEEYEIKGTGLKPRAYMLPPACLEDKVLLKKMRRSDKLSRMSVLSASDALADAGLDPGSEDIGVILATSLGAHNTTFGFLDDILDYGELAVSPTTFSNSVHNAAASYIASVLGITGPTLTVTRFSFPFYSALELAGLWLRDGRCRHVLVGTSEECGDVERFVYEKKFGSDRDGRIRPFNLSPQSPPVPGEGSLFMLVSLEASSKAYCSVKKITFGVSLPDIVDMNLCVIDYDGTSGGDGYLRLLATGVRTVAYAPCFGSIPAGSAFNAAAAALMLKNQVVYPNPVAENPDAFELASSGPQEIDLIRCIGYNCTGENGLISLIRSANRQGEK